MLYNAEVKERFLKECKAAESTKAKRRGLFIRLGDLEERCGKDVCTMTKDELREVLGGAISIGSAGRATQLSDLRTYAKWCMANNIEGACDELIDFDARDIENDDKVVMQTVASPQHLKRVLDFVFGDESRRTLACVFRTFLWLAYSGLPNADDAMNVRNGDVDLDNMMVIYKDNEYPIYGEALRCFRDSINLNEIVIPNPQIKGRDSMMQVLDRAGGDYLLRTTTQEQPDRSLLERRVVRATLMARKKATDKDKSVMRSVSYNRMWESGVFYRMYEAERLGMPANFEDVAIQRIKAGGGQITKQKKSRHRRDLERNYEAWKRVYSAGD